MSDDFNVGAERETIPTVPLKEKGDTFEGKIVAREKRQDYSYVTPQDRERGEKSEPLFWNSKGKKVTDDTGKPVEVIVLTLEDASGERFSLYVKGSIFIAFRNLAEDMKKAGDNRGVQFDEGATVKLRRGNGGKGELVEYQVKVTPPVVSVGASDFAADEEQPDF